MLLTIQVLVRETLKSRASAAARLSDTQVAATLPQLMLYCSNKTAAQIATAES